MSGECIQSTRIRGLWTSISHLKFRGRNGNFLASIKLSFPLPWNINWHPPQTRPTVSSIGSPCYALAECLPLAGNTDSFVKNSQHFIQLIQEFNLQNKDCLERYDVSASTNVPADEVLQVIINSLNTGPFFLECSPLQVEDVMELLDICLTATYFQFEDLFWCNTLSRGLFYSSTPFSLIYKK
jgi:hypothetical protein